MLNVLIVDDEELVREMVKRCINWAEIGLNIIGEADSARVGLAMVDELHPDLVFMDVKMLLSVFVMCIHIITRIMFRCSVRTSCMSSEMLFGSAMCRKRKLRSMKS